MPHTPARPADHEGLLMELVAALTIATVVVSLVIIVQAVLALSDRRRAVRMVAGGWLVAQLMDEPGPHFSWARFHEVTSSLAPPDRKVARSAGYGLRRTIRGDDMDAGYSSDSSLVRAVPELLGQDVQARALSRWGEMVEEEQARLVAAVSGLGRRPAPAEAVALYRGLMSRRAVETADSEPAVRWWWPLRVSLSRVLDYVGNGGALGLLGVVLVYVATPMTARQAVDAASWVAMVGAAGGSLWSAAPLVRFLWRTDRSFALGLLAIYLLAIAGFVGLKVLAPR